MNLFRRLKRAAESYKTVCMSDMLPLIKASFSFEGKADQALSMIQKSPAGSIEKVSLQIKVKRHGGHVRHEYYYLPSITKSDCSEALSHLDKLVRQSRLDTKDADEVQSMIYRMMSEL